MANKGTKTGSLGQEFLRHAQTDQEGALATMFLAAFGVSLAALMGICDKMIKENATAAMVMAITASVQIRNHVVFVGRDYADIRTRFPELVIDGQRSQQDSYNFGALHALGHLLCHITNDPLGRKAIAKAGSCITGEAKTDSEAGKINSEIADSWTAEDKTLFAAWLPGVKTSAAVQVDTIFKSFPKLSADFNAKMAAKTTPPPFSRPATKASAAAAAAPPT